jgi:hypothetical protein
MNLNIRVIAKLPRADARHAPRDPVWMWRLAGRLWPFDRASTNRVCNSAQTPES